MLGISRESTIGLRVPRADPALAVYLRQVLALAAKDVRSELRSRQVLSTTVVFALMVLVVFNFAFDLGSAEMDRLAPAMLWVAITLAAVLGLNHVFGKEKEQASLEGLLLCPVDRSAVYFGKFLGALAFTMAMEAAVLPIFVAFTDQGVFSAGPLLALLLGTVGFLAVGTLFAAISSSTKTREILLPVLLFPIATPILVAGVEVTRMGVSGEPFSEFAGWLGLLAAFDVVFLVVCPMLFEQLVDELGP
jgi:heme exporter protein B